MNSGNQTRNPELAEAVAKRIDLAARLHDAVRPIDEDPLARLEREYERPMLSGS